MMSMLFCRRFAAILFLLSAALCAQSADQDSAQPLPSQEVLKANTRLVVVDVVVTDGKGQPISDLKAEDFSGGISAFIVNAPGRAETFLGHLLSRPAHLCCECLIPARL